MKLLEAVMAKSLSRVKKVLEEDSSAVKREGREALFRAADQGEFFIVKHLIEYSGVNIRDLGTDGSSVLHHAVKSGQVELVRYLVERCGCNPMEGNLRGETPFDAAHRCQPEYQEIERYFQEVCHTSYDNTYHNPIRQGFYPDPSVVRVGDDYYMVNSSFCYIPCIPVSHSRDLVNWEVIGHVITESKYAHLEHLEGGRGYWAPDISYCDGEFYVTATYRLNEVQGMRRIQMVTSSKNPEGPYGEPVFIEEDGIDPSIFHDEDGRHYMLLNRGARIFELSADCRRKISDAELLWYGDYKVNPEGPHILKKDGWYYLFLAEGGTGMGHQISVARSGSLKGPYESCPYNPILTQRNQGALIQCCGHGKPVMTHDGRWYLVYLCLRIPESGYGILGRETSLDPIIWTEDGWPIVNGGRGPSCQQVLPFPEMRVNADTAEVWEEHEKRKESGVLDWTDAGWLVHRHGMDAISSRKDGAVVIRGDEFDLHQLASRSMMLRRQQDFCFEAMCRVEVDFCHITADLGMTCYYDENSYIKLGVTVRDGIHGVGVWEYVGNSYRSHVFVPLGSLRDTWDCPTILVELNIVTQDLQRICLYRTAGEEWREAARLEDTSYLSSEGLKLGKRFTGAMVGLYVHGRVEGIFSSFTYNSK